MSQKESGPGAKTAKQNKDFKSVLGSAPNSTANKYLKEARGKVVNVRHMGVVIAHGILESWDLYSLEVAGCLIFKGPGLIVEICK